MLYAMPQDYFSAFGEQEAIQLTDRQGVGAVDGGVLAAALASASGVMDGYIGGRYALPLSTTTPLLKKVCLDLARFELHGNQAGDIVVERKKDAYRTLEGVSRGGVDLGLDAGNHPAPTDKNRVSFGAGRPNVFGGRA
jgi:phage gp36-like protein